MEIATHLTALRRPSRSDWVLIGIFWATALLFILLDTEKILVKYGWLRFIAGTVWSILTPLSLSMVIVYVLMPVFLFRKRYVLFLLSLVLVSMGIAAIYRLVEGVIWRYSPNMSWLNISYSLESIIRSVGMLVAILTGKHFIEMQQRLLRSEKERAEAELRHLKAQIDPHFLFNNLNVLGALIQRNPHEASDYLHRFSALYRYLIRHKDDDAVPLADELAFANDYTYLIRQRFGCAYALRTTINVPDLLDALVSPGAIQTLIENAVKHNQGSDANPLEIELVIDEQNVTVRNARRPKLTPTDSTQTGLANLTARYRPLPPPDQRTGCGFVRKQRACGYVAGVDIPMTILILEDEPVAAQYLTDLLLRQWPGAQVLGTLRSIQEARQWFAANPAPNLLFSDIELLDGNAFALYETVQVRCPIIFTTAYDQFLLRAFQTNGIAYLLKPVDEQALAQALSKYEALRNTFQTDVPASEPLGLSPDVLAQLRQALQPAANAYKQRFTVRMRNSIYLLPVEQITYLQADDSVVFAFDAAGQRYPLTGTLTELEQQLDPARFFRLNRGEIVALSAIDRLEPYGDRLAVRLRGISTAFVSSTTKTPELRKWLDQ